MGREVGHAAVAPVKPEPVTLPIATRAWCIRDPLKPDAESTIPRSISRRPPDQRPSRFIALDTECATAAPESMHGFAGERWAWEGQPFLFGSAVIGRTRDWVIEREVIFYPDDLPDAGIAALRGYVEQRSYRRGALPRNPGGAEPDRIWRQERRVVVALLPLSRFLKLFYRIAYEDRALVIGYGLAFTLTRLAAHWRELKKGDNIGAWRLTLWTYRDAVTGADQPSAGWRPYIDIKRAAPDVTFIELSGRREGPRYRGEFLDLSNLAHALTGRHWTLAEACAAFTGEVIGSSAEQGRIAPDCISHRRSDVRAIVSLAAKLPELFDRLHPVSRGAGGRLSETRLYSPGGIARAYLAAAGFTPPAVPRDRLGVCATAFFGGCAEVQLRGRAPVVHVDFRRQYQTVFLLQGLQDLLAAERLSFIDDTETVRAFVEAVTLDDLLRPETWPKLNVLCWIKPCGEILPVRAAFGGRAGVDRFTMAMAERYSDGPVVMYLGNVIAAKLLSGRAPEIIRAERIVPEGRQQLRKTRLFGGARFEPAKDQLFKILVEEGERFGRGQGRYAKIPAAIREAILPGIKAIGNIGCFGALIETRAADLLPGRREEVTLLTDGEPVRAAVAHPEDPGPFACPPLAGLVTAGGRLLLAMVHRMVADRGGIVAACDTDGAHIVATEKGGTVYIETRGADYHEGRPAEPIRALSRAEVREIAERFEPLNPFDRALLPGSPLRLKGASEGLFISAKRYALSQTDGSFVDFKESILGMLSPPSAGWIEEAWRSLGEIWDGRLLTPRPWFGLPALRRLAITSPAIARDMKGLPNLRPWNSFLVGTALGRKPSEREPRTAVVVAPFEPDPERWADVPWRFADSGEPVQFGGADSNEIKWRLRTLREFLESYARHSIPEMLAPDGSRCGPYTRGVLKRRAVRDGERWLVLKEAAVYGDTPQNAFSLTPPEAVRQPGRADDDEGAAGIWETAIRPGLAIVGPATVARKLGLAARTGRAWVAGARRPEKPRDVAQAVVAVARDAGLGLPTDEHLRSDEIYAELPARALGVQFFISFATAMLADRFGGVRPFARALAGEGGPDLEPAVRRWIALAGGELRPITDLNRIVARLSKFSRAEIRKMRRRIATEAGPAGDRQIIVAYLSVLYATDMPVVLGSDKALFAPVVFAIAVVVALFVQIASTGRGVEPSLWSGGAEGGR
jgi:hypothetical protein